MSSTPSPWTAWYSEWMLLNVHFHMLAFDGVYADDAYGKIRFRRIKVPTVDELGVLAHRISHRVAKCLERRGVLARDEENTYLHLDLSEDEAMQQLYGHSITYRIALGPHQGRKVFTLPSLPPQAEPRTASSRVAHVAGFSLHAGIMTEAHQRDKARTIVPLHCSAGGFRDTSIAPRRRANTL